MGIFEANFSNFEVYRKSVAPKKSYPATHIIIMKVFKRNHNGNRQLLNGKRSKNCFFEYIFHNLGVTEFPDRKKKVTMMSGIVQTMILKKKTTEIAKKPTEISPKTVFSRNWYDLSSTYFYEKTVFGLIFVGFFAIFVVFFPIS